MTSDKYLEEYVNFDTAKRLMEMGFDEYCSHFYRLDGEHEYCCKAKLPQLTNNDIRNHDDWVNREFACTCPTLQVAMKWLRETHKLFIEVHIVGHSTVYMDNKYYFYRLYKDRRPLKLVEKTFMTYEEACEDAINNCLDNYVYKDEDGI